jgi:DNA-binding protein HU-beta
LNKNDLVTAVANKASTSKADAAKAIDGVFAAITTSLQQKEEVRLVGFGTFSVARRAASIGRNPRTGERINIPASNQPKFKAGKGLKAAVNY